MVYIFNSFYHIKFKTTYLRYTITNAIMQMKKIELSLSHFVLNRENQHLSLGLSQSKLFKRDKNLAQGHVAHLYEK